MKRLPTSSTERGAIPALAALALLCALLSLCVGAVPVTPGEVLRALLGGERQSVAARIVLYTRLPRTLSAIVCGCALAVAGAVIQTVLCNPLASPGVIGVNASAGLAVALCCALRPASAASVPAIGFVGALTGVLGVMLLSELAGASRTTVLLAGVAASSLFGAAIDAVLTFVPDALSGYADFRVGGFAGATTARLMPAAAMILPCLLLTLTLGRQMDVLALGTETAQSLGLRVRPMRLLLLTLAAALCGAAISVCGLLGFVGLIVPHIMRRLVGGGSLRLTAACALGGAALVTACDTLARVIFAPYELPVGVVLSFAGVPFFLWLLLARRGGHAHD